MTSPSGTLASDLFWSEIWGDLLKISRGEREQLIIFLKFWIVYLKKRPSIFYQFRISQMWRVLFVNREFFVCSDEKFLIILLLLFFILKGNSVTFHSLFLCTIVLPIIVIEQTQLSRFFLKEYSKNLLKLKLIFKCIK